MTNPLNVLLPKEAPPQDAYRWGSVMSVDPLRVRFDGDTAPIPADLKTLAQCAVGDRVYGQLRFRRVTILGVLNRGGQSPELPVGTDLNNLTVPGVYIRSITADASLALNYPMVVAGLLEVFQNEQGNHVWQRYTPYGNYSNTFYVRAKYSGSWSRWARYGRDGGDLGSGYNLNNVKTPGIYSVSTNEGAIAGTNFPVGYAGLLEVFGDTGYAADPTKLVWQRYTPYGGYSNTFYVRSFYSSWSAWTKYGDEPYFFEQGVLNNFTTVVSWQGVTASRLTNRTNLGVGSAWNQAGSYWTCPVDGAYSFVAGSYSNTSNAGSSRWIMQYGDSIGGSGYARAEQDVNAAGMYVGVTISFDKICSANEKIYLGFYCNNGFVGRTFTGTYSTMMLNSGIVA